MFADRTSPWVDAFQRFTFVNSSGQAMTVLECELGAYDTII